jgi:hypothetical protein
MMVNVLRKWGLSIGTTAVVLALVWAVSTVLAQEPDGGAGITGVQGGSPVVTMTYQGRLQDGGSPANGLYDFTLSVWSDGLGGNQLGATQVYDDIVVQDGLFTIYFTPGDTNEVFNGSDRWLEVEACQNDWVNCQVMRQPITNVPYAWGLRPGAIISSTYRYGSEFGNGILNITNEAPSWHGTANGLYVQSSTSSAVRAESGGVAVYAESDTTYAIQAQSYGEGTAGYFSSVEGYGIRVDADGNNRWDHAGYFTSDGGYGLYAQSATNTAVRGEAGYVATLAQTGGEWGVVGLGVAGGVFGSSDSGRGVYGTSDSNSGVYGETDSADSNHAGVHGYNNSSGGRAVRGLKYGGSGVAIDGDNLGTTGSGTSGYSSNFVGVWGETGASSNDYGFYTPDNIYSLNYNLRGAIMQVVQNGDSTSLQPGDVVVFSGLSAPREAGEPPVIQVSHAATVNDSAVAGVVYSGYDPDRFPDADGYVGETDVGVVPGGAIAPGEYLLLVVHGPAEVRASALSGDIQTGDLLSTGARAGYATAASQVTVDGVAFTPPGIVFGKALEPLDRGRDATIYVFVTLQ